MPRKKIIIDSSDDDDEVVSTPIKKNKQKKTDDDPPYKKRGPKKKIIRKTSNITFTLSDTDSDSEEKDIISENELSKQKNSIKIKKNTFNKPWIEKYRPTNVDELVLDENTHNKIKKIIEDKNMPNIIVTGVPGIGKTTTVLCIAKNLLKQHFQDAILELNASDERGVKTVHESIEYFCKKKIDFDNTTAKHKIVLLDEADNMTTKAQQAINNLMETYHQTTRFAFTCNNSYDIIEAIQSRCIIFRYNRLLPNQMLNRLRKICELEKINFNDDGLKTIVAISQGDLRRAINNLQLTYNSYTNIIPENVYKLCDKPHPLAIQNIFIACHQKDVKTALTHLNDLRNKGYSSSDISLSMMSTLKDMNNDIFDETTKMQYMEEVGKACLVISKGINTPLQLSGCIAILCKTTLH